MIPKIYFASYLTFSKVLMTLMIPWHNSIKLLKSENNLLAIYKPCDILSHPNDDRISEKSVIQARYSFKQEAYLLNDGTLVYLLNRLDSPTSGIILLSTDISVAQQVRILFKQHNVHKTYLAIVKGNIPNDTLLLKDFLKTQKSTNNVRSYISSRAQGILCETKIKKICSIETHYGKLNFIKLEPITGRTHQLRVQCSQHNFPILGDKIYGNFDCNKNLKTKRLYLHAQTISLTFSGHSFNATCQPDFEPFIESTFKFNKIT